MDDPETVVDALRLLKADGYDIAVIDQASTVVVPADQARGRRGERGFGTGIGCPSIHGSAPIRA